MYVFVNAFYDLVRYFNYYINNTKIILYINP